MQEKTIFIISTWIYCEKWKWGRITFTGHATLKKATLRYFKFES